MNYPFAGLWVENQTQPRLHGILEKGGTILKAWEIVRGSGDPGPCENPVEQKLFLFSLATSKTNNATDNGKKMGERHD